MSDRDTVFTCSITSTAPTNYGCFFIICFFIIRLSPASLSSNLIFIHTNSSQLYTSFSVKIKAITKEYTPSHSHTFVFTGIWWYCILACRILKISMIFCLNSIISVETDFLPFSLCISIYNPRNTFGLSSTSTTIFLSMGSFHNYKNIKLQLSHLFKTLLFLNW